MAKQHQQATSKVPLTEDAMARCVFWCDSPLAGSSLGMDGHICSACNGRIIIYSMHGNQLHARVCVRVH